MVREKSIVAIETSEVLATYRERIAKAFQEVFGDEPWNERWYCEACGASYGSVRPPADLTCCDTQLVAFYTDDDALRIVDDAYAKPGAAMLVATDEQDEVIAFYWCRVESSHEIEPRLQAAVAACCGGNLPRRYIMSSEAGVLRMHRGQKLSQRLFLKGIASVCKIDADVEAVLNKTNPQSPMYYLRLRVGFAEIFREEDTGDVYMLLAPAALSKLLEVGSEPYGALERGI